MRDGHWHLHAENGSCYGDTFHFEDAATAAASHTYPWCVPDNDPVDDILTVIEADFCIDICRQDYDDNEEDFS